MKATTRILLGCLLFAVPLHAATIHVPGDQPTIQAGLNTASPGDVVLVAPGTYFENLIWPATQGIRLESENGPESTIIDGSAPSHPDTGSVVVFAVGLEATTVLEGFTIRNGPGTLHSFPVPNYQGGGILCHSSSPTITDNIITGNMHSRIAVGGGLSIGYDASPTITGNRIANNRAIATPQGIGGFGGGIFSYQSSEMITGNEISGNTALRGGGIAALDSYPTIDQNTITGNTANHDGGGIEFQPAFLGSTPGGAPIITGNTITGNKGLSGIGGGITGLGPTGGGTPHIVGNMIAGNLGGGIRCDASYGPIQALIEYCRVEENAGHGIRCDSGATPTIEFCVIEDNEGAGVYCFASANPVIHYNDISGHEIDGGVMNTSASVTIDAELNWWGDASGPTHLSNPGGLGDPVSDYVDYSPWSISTGVAQPVEQASSTRFFLSANRPNPFNPFTTIQFSLSRSDQVTLRVYDVLGREVATLVNEVRDAGSHIVSWDGSGAASGVYFYRIEAGDWTETRPMTLVR